MYKQIETCQILASKVSIFPTCTEAVVLKLRTNDNGAKALGRLLLLKKKKKKSFLFFLSNLLFIENRNIKSFLL